jgi:GT2 family glycosyltransferase
MRAEAVRQTGRYWEPFFYLFDEPDYHLRMRRLGWKVECVPAAVGWQEPAPPNPYMLVRNQLGFVARNAPRRILVREILRVTWYLVRDTVRPRPGVTRSDVRKRLRGLVDFLRGRWGAPPP